MNRHSVTAFRSVLCVVTMTFAAFAGRDASAQQPLFFGTPVPLEINSTSLETSGNMTLDGLQLFFASVRPGSAGGIDIWSATRTERGAPWRQPEPLGPEVNTGLHEMFSVISADGLTLYFSREGGWQMWAATRDDPQDNFQMAQVIPGPVNDGSAQPSCISSDGLHLWFAAQRPESRGGRDFWVATRENPADPFNSPFEMVVNLGAPVNGPSRSEATMTISPDEQTIILAGNPWVGPLPLAGGQGGPDLWITTRDAAGVISARP